MKTENATFAVSLGLFILAMTLLYGWCVNLYLLVIGCMDFTVTSNWAMLMLRGIGVLVAPVGALLGLFV